MRQIEAILTKYPWMVIKGLTHYVAYNGHHLLVVL